MALPLHPDPAQQFIFDDLDAMPHDGRRWELIAGSLVVSPASSGAHQWCVMRLAAALDAAAPAGMMVIPAPYDWRVQSTYESFQPDVMVIQAADFDPAGPLQAMPLLVVEILSRGSADHDQRLKHARYETLGVPAYWIIDPVVPLLVEFRLSDHGRYNGLYHNRYTERAQIIGDDRFTTGYPFPVTLSPAALTRRG